MIKFIVKRDGRLAFFDINKIRNALTKAMQATNEYDNDLLHSLTDEILIFINKKYENENNINIEDVQNIIEDMLIKNNLPKIAKAFILYRDKRSRIRMSKTKLMSVLNDLTYKDSEDNDLKRENANIDGETSMGMMLRYGSETSKTFYRLNVLNSQHSKAHESGDIHIHDLDFYALTTTCCQIDLEKLFDGGFNTGHGFLREPNSIQSYASLACIAIQSNQNDQHGGQSIPKFDHDMAMGVCKTYIKNICLVLKLTSKIHPVRIKDISKFLFEYIKTNKRIMDEAGTDFIIKRIRDIDDAIDIASVLKNALELTERDTYQAMESLVHNLNTLHSRSGGQVPFSSLNYGTDVSKEGRMVIKNILLATEAGLGHGETPIFPIQIFKVKDGVNFNESDPNYDLFTLSCRVSAKRLFPNYVFIDAPYNLQYYKEGHPETEACTMGCRTRVIGNIYDKDRQIVTGRGNLSFTSINLPRLGIKHKNDISGFYQELKEKINLVFDQLVHRFKIQSQKKVRNFPFLMRQGVWIDSEKLNPNDTIGEILKHGTLTVGFIGLAECLKALIGSHHGETEEAQALGLNIIGIMRSMCDIESKLRGLNFSLIGTPAESLSGRFVKIDQKIYGKIDGITDREYYTNSFHIPVYFPISAAKKIQLEAPYHALTNGGHITYIELDGDPCQNIEAFRQIVCFMKECGIGYGAINHPVDHDPVCGYTGIIGDTCPRCGRRDGEAISPEMLQKIRKQYNQ